MAETGASAVHEDEYDDALLTLLQLVWGDGFLSPGGPEAVRAIVGAHDLQDLDVLDVGCGLGGIDVLLARDFGARVVGVDVESDLVRRARQRMLREGLADRVEIMHVDPGPLPFPDESFDVVFSKDSWIHVEDKGGLFADVYRVLRPGGALLAGDWMRGPEPFSSHMEYFFALEGLTYHMDTLPNAGAALAASGFHDIHLEDITEEYRRQAHVEYENMRGPWRDRMRDSLGEDKAAHFVENWRALTVVLDRGELRPARLRARRPA